MSVTRIPIDGLWRCLCPSFDRIPLRRLGGQLKKNGDVGAGKVKRGFHSGGTKGWSAEGVGAKGGGEDRERDVDVQSEREERREGGSEARARPMDDDSNLPPLPILRRVPIEPAKLIAAQDKWMLQLAREAQQGRRAPNSRRTRPKPPQQPGGVLRKVYLATEPPDGVGENALDGRGTEGKVRLMKSYVDLENAQARWLKKQEERRKAGGDLNREAGDTAGSSNIPPGRDASAHPISPVKADQQGGLRASEPMIAFPGGSRIPLRRNGVDPTAQEIGGQTGKREQEIPTLAPPSFDSLKEESISFSQAYAQEIRQAEEPVSRSPASSNPLNWKDRPTNEKVHDRGPKFSSPRIASDASLPQGSSGQHEQELISSESKESQPQVTGEEPLLTKSENEISSQSTTLPKAWNDTPLTPEVQDLDVVDQSEFMPDILDDQEEVASDYIPPISGEVEAVEKLSSPAKVTPMIDSKSPGWSKIPTRRNIPKPVTELDKDSGSISREPLQSDVSRLATSYEAPSLHVDATHHELGPSFHEPPIIRPAWDKIPSVHLHDRLRSLTTMKNAYSQICELVTYLIRNRGEQPALIHYNALIRANADAEAGSVNVVKHLLQEMKTIGIGGDSGLYHGVLQVLAIHPDYLLRDQVLQEMKIRWFGLSPEGWHNYVIGLIRDRQYELAMDKLEQMQSDNIVIQPWLYDIFMFQLCDAGELDEVLKLLKYRYEHNREGIETSLWYYVLDAFTKAYHYEGTTFIWKRRISTQHIVPSDGICTATLNMAARYADAKLATSAVRILSTRLPVLAMHHYEALLTAYAASGDIKTAFRILGIMSKAQMHPDMSTTRPIFAYLSKSVNLCQIAWADLKSLSDEGHIVPVTAANVILEATWEVGHFDQAVALYKELHEIIETGPNVETFNTLLQGAVYAGRKDLCMFLASEMAALDISPNHLTYDRLILACLSETDYEDAFRYLEEMMEVGADKGDGGWWMRKGTALALAKRCATAGDERAWEIYNHMLDRGMEVKEAWIAEKWQQGQQGQPESQLMARLRHQP